MDTAAMLFSSSEKNLFHLMTGFFASKVLAVAVELDLFTWLSGKPRTFEEIRSHFGLAERPCRTWLDALLNLHLLERQGALYANSAVSEALLVRGRPDYQGPHVRLLDSLYLACHHLRSALLEDRPISRDYSYFFGPEADDSRVTHYSMLMHESSLAPAMVLPHYWDFSDSQVVMDVGGGYGRLCLTLVSQYPHLQAILFDLPEVCQKAGTLLETYPRGLVRRVRLHPGDFFRDPLPQGADTIIMMRITHDWPQERVAMLFQKAFSALPSGGRLLVYETLKDQGPFPGDAAFISLLLLLISPGGECRTFAELQTLLERAGFTNVELIPTIYFYGLIVAEKP
ncbi:MAG: acetylserotonin O-methyltransferase [Candidatus Binatia bacterium]|nr:acetylserotonin O-methyltransferase [Candidatus Binatia bacterium]